MRDLRSLPRRVHPRVSAVPPQGSDAAAPPRTHQALHRPHGAHWLSHGRLHSRWDGPSVPDDGPCRRRAQPPGQVPPGHLARARPGLCGPGPHRHGDLAQPDRSLARRAHQLRHPRPALRAPSVAVHAVLRPPSDRHHHLAADPGRQRDPGPARLRAPVLGGKPSHYRRRERGPPCHELEARAYCDGPAAHPLPPRAQALAAAPARLPQLVVSDAAIPWARLRRPRPREGHEGLLPAAVRDRALPVPQRRPARRRCLRRARSSP